MKREWTYGTLNDGTDVTAAVLFRIYFLTNLRHVRVESSRRSMKEKGESDSLNEN